MRQVKYLAQLPEKGGRNIRDSSKECIWDPLHVWEMKTGRCFPWSFCSHLAGGISERGLPCTKKVWALKSQGKPALASFSGPFLSDAFFLSLSSTHFQINSLFLSSNHYNHLGEMPSFGCLGLLPINFNSASVNLIWQAKLFKLGTVPGLRFYLGPFRHESYWTQGTPASQTGGDSLNSPRTQP